MNVPFSIAQRVQWNLQIMACGPEDLSPISFKHGSALPEKDARQDWQYSVEIIYRLLEIDFLCIEGVENKQDQKLYCLQLAYHSPFNMDGDGATVWMGLLLYATDACKRLLKKHSIDHYDAPTCKKFWEEVEVLFEAAGVPWTDEPLFPIRMNWTAARRGDSIRQAAIRKEKEQVAQVEHDRLAEVARQEKIKKQQARIIRRLEQKKLAMKK